MFAYFTQLHTNHSKMPIELSTYIQLLFTKMYLNHLAINDQTFVTFHSAVTELPDLKLQSTTQNLHANMEGFCWDSTLYIHIDISIQTLNRIILLWNKSLFACTYSLYFVKLHGIGKYYVTCSLLKVCSCTDANVSTSSTIE